MKKEEELKLRGTALDGRILHHQKLSHWFGLPFLAGLVVLVGGVALSFINTPNRPFWGALAFGGFLLGLVSMAIGSWHFGRVDDLKECMGKQSAAPKPTQSAKDLYKKDEAPYDDMFTPQTSLDSGTSPQTPGLTDEGWEDLKEGW